MPLSREFLLSRGRCCGNGCVNCPYLEKSMFTPRDYQQESIDAFWRGTKTHKGQNPLLVLPTGAGKTIVIADILRGLRRLDTDQLCLPDRRSWSSKTSTSSPSIYLMSLAVSTVRGLVEKKRHQTSYLERFSPAAPREKSLVSGS